MQSTRITIAAFWKGQHCLPLIVVTFSMPMNIMRKRIFNIHFFCMREKIGGGCGKGSQKGRQGI